LQICQLTSAEAEKIQRGLVVDSHLHSHLSRNDARQLVENGRVRFINERAVVPVGCALLSDYWYDWAVLKNDRHWATVGSGPVTTRQMVSYMPKRKHKVKRITACGAPACRQSVRAINAEVGGGENEPSRTA
jgi:hypothetical protein